MAGQKIESGATSHTVARNLKRLREAQGLTYTDVSRLLEGVDYVGISPLAVRRMEEAARRIDTADLMALSIVLNVNPNALLLPAYGGGEDESDNVTGMPKGVSGAELWAWADGWKALPVHRADAPEVDSNASGMERGRQMYRKHAAEQGRGFLHRIRPDGEADHIRAFFTSIYEKIESLEPGEWLTVWGHSEDSERRADRVDSYPAMTSHDLLELMKRQRAEGIGVMRASVALVSPKEAAQAVTPDEEK